jgi:hypothetical protein
MMVPVAVVRHLSKAAQRSYESQMAEMDHDSDGDDGDHVDDRDRDDNVSCLKRPPPVSVCEDSSQATALHGTASHGTALHVTAWHSRAVLTVTVRCVCLCDKGCRRHRLDHCGPEVARGSRREAPVQVVGAGVLPIFASCHRCHGTPLVVCVAGSQSCDHTRTCTPRFAPPPPAVVPLSLRS